MKRIAFVAMIVFCAFPLIAKEATLNRERVCSSDACMSEWTPFALTLCGPVGLPWGNWDVKGLQVGVFNSTYMFTGLQIGVVNVSEKAYGFQIGFINVISGDDCSFLPVLNWSF